ncbi:MAG: TolC family protein [Ignavibacteriae bacterium]|nr:TolC family protein [Ignavibacteriota bacterium]
MFRKLIFPLIFDALIGVARLAYGQIQPTNPDSALQIILSHLEGTSLSLTDAMKYGLQNATSVRTAEATYLAARGAARREAGGFDPELFFALNHLDQELPTASFFSGAPVLSTTQTITSGGLRMELPIGTNIEASLSTLRLKTNSAFAFLNPQYTAFGSLSFRQPLLGGLHISARKQARKADQEMEAAKARYDQEVLAISTEAEHGYWDLYAVERDYAVQKLTRDRAEAFLRETELRAKTGLIGPNQVANARTFLAEQEILLLDREEQLDRLSDQLASLIGTRPDAGQRRFITIDDPPAEFPLEDVDALVQQAIQNNLDLQAAKADVEAKRTLSSAAFWEALPSVNLVGSLGGSGLLGTLQDVSFGDTTYRAPSDRQGQFGDVISQAVKREFPSWSVGVEVNIPIALRSGLGEKERLEAEVMMAEQQYIQQARILEERARSAYRELSHGKQRLIAAREGVDAAQEQVRIGLIEFQNGLSTAFELVRLGADFAVAQQRYSQALVRGAKAAATLRQLTSGEYKSGAVR